MELIKASPPSSRRSPHRDGHVLFDLQLAVVRGPSEDIRAGLRERNLHGRLLVLHQYAPLIELGIVRATPHDPAELQPLRASRGTASPCHLRNTQHDLRLVR